MVLLSVRAFVLLSNSVYSLFSVVRLFRFPNVPLSVFRTQRVFPLIVNDDVRRPPQHRFDAHIAAEFPRLHGKIPLHFRKEQLI